MVEETPSPSACVLPEQLDKLHSLQRELPEMKKEKERKRNLLSLTLNT
jgi:hypothetical protein